MARTVPDRRSPLVLLLLGALALAGVAHHQDPAVAAPVPTAGPEPAPGRRHLRGDSPYTALFESAGAAHGIDPAVLEAVARVESGFRPDARSAAGALGLMQIMPGTAQTLGIDPMDPAQAVDGAARILAGDLAEFGSLDEALAAYNAGAGAVQKYGGIPPYAETQHYVAAVEAALA